KADVAERGHENRGRRGSAVRRETAVQQLVANDPLTFVTDQLACEQRIARRRRRMVRGGSHDLLVGSPGEKLNSLWTQTGRFQVVQLGSTAPRSVTARRPSASLTMATNLPLASWPETSARVPSCEIPCT